MKDEYKRVSIKVHPQDLEAMQRMTGERTPTWAAQAFFNRYLTLPFSLEWLGNHQVPRDLWRSACQVALESNKPIRGLIWLNEQLVLEGKEPVTKDAFYRQLRRYKAEQDE